MEKFPIADSPESQKKPSKGFGKVLRNAGIASLFTLSTIAGTAQNNNEADSLKSPVNKELIKETGVEKFQRFFDSLQNKSPDEITPEEMDMFADGLYKYHDQIKDKDVFDNAKQFFLNKVYEKHSPYSIEKKKITVIDLPAGYDLDIGFDKNDRIMFNHLLTESGFDSTNVEIISSGMMYHGSLVNFGYRIKKEFGDKILKITVDDSPHGVVCWATITDKKTGKSNPNFFPTRDEKTDNHVFAETLDKMISNSK